MYCTYRILKSSRDRTKHSTKQHASELDITDLNCLAVVIDLCTCTTHVSTSATTKLPTRDCFADVVNIIALFFRADFQTHQNCECCGSFATPTQVVLQKRERTKFTGHETRKRILQNRRRRTMVESEHSVKQRRTKAQGAVWCDTEPSKVH